MAEHRIWFDCDTGVDDAIALLTAHRQPGLEIVGLSTVAGNVTLGHTTENTLKICGLMGADYPVYPGAPGPLRREREDASSFHGADGLGGAVLPAPRRAPEQTPAWDALYEAAARMPGELTLVATGPLTNAAIALTAHPALRSLLRGIALMGGAAVVVSMEALVGYYPCVMATLTRTTNRGGRQCQMGSLTGAVAS